MSIEIDLQHSSKLVAAPSDNLISLWVNNALCDELDQAAVSIRIVDETESQQLNSEYRGKDSPTNVLSFPFVAPKGIPADAFDHLIGDLVICAPIVEKEAAEQGKDSSNHWAHMLTHGILHLLGYDHITDEQAHIMEALERKLLLKLNIPDPYQNEPEVS